MRRAEAERVKKLLLRIIRQKEKVVKSYIERGLWMEGMLHMENVVGNIYPDFGVALERYIEEPAPESEKRREVE